MRQHSSLYSQVRPTPHFNEEVDWVIVASCAVDSLISLHLPVRRGCPDPNSCGCMWATCLSINGTFPPSLFTHPLAVTNMPVCQWLCNEAKAARSLNPASSGQRNVLHEEQIKSTISSHGSGAFWVKGKTRSLFVYKTYNHYTLLRVYTLKYFEMPSSPMWNML